MAVLRSFAQASKTAPSSGLPSSRAAFAVARRVPTACALWIVRAALPEKV
jgi:hypothetical protein